MPITRYRQFDQSGLYTLRATHDFGWKAGTVPHPVAEATITLLVPNAEQAEKVVLQMEALAAQESVSLGERTADFADFTALRHPVYLAPLRQRAGSGDERALVGIAQIATPEATATLIDLAAHPDSKLAFEAAKQLALRLPEPLIPEEAARIWAASAGVELPHARLVRLSWEERFRPHVRSVGKQLLSSTKADEINCGASILASVGAVDDAPEIKKAIDSALQLTISPRRERKDNILDFPEPLRLLIRAMQALRGRDFQLGESLSGDDEILLYFMYLQGDASPRPERWRQIFESFATASPYAVREAAWRSVPCPLPDWCRPALLTALSDGDLGVVRTACSVAGDSEEPQLIGPLLEIIATENHEWLLREASEAALKLGAKYDLWEVWTSRLGDEHLYSDALNYLQKIVEVRTGSYSGRTDLTRAERLALRGAWERFLRENEQALRAGKRFLPDDPAVHVGLFGRARTFTLRDGRKWPDTH